MRWQIWQMEVGVAMSVEGPDLGRVNLGLVRISGAVCSKF